MFVSCVECLNALGIRLTRYLIASFFIISNTQERRLNHLRDFSDSRPKSWEIFSGEVPCMAPVIAKVALCCADSHFLHKELLKG